MVYCKPPFGGPEQVLAYLANYTHRIAISNSRLVAFDGGSVTFRYRDYADGNTTKTMTLDADEFLRRFLLHVLPTRFVRIRYYGFLANRGRLASIAHAREQIMDSSPRAAARATCSSGCALSALQRRHHAARRCCLATAGAIRRLRGTPHEYGDEVRLCSALAERHVHALLTRDAGALSARRSATTEGGSFTVATLPSTLSVPNHIERGRTGVIRLVTPQSKPMAMGGGSVQHRSYRNPDLTILPRVIHHLRSGSCHRCRYRRIPVRAFNVSLVRLCQIGEDRLRCEAVARSRRS